jgi:four helix bundle protein
MNSFDHEKLDVYQVALEFVATAGEILESFPPGRHDLVDQLNRASTSIVLNIAEGAGEFSRAEKVRFYRMAKRSATECAAALDVGRVRKLITGGDVE